MEEVRKREGEKDFSTIQTQMQTKRKQVSSEMNEEQFNPKQKQQRFVLLLLL